jgi:inosine-uridine nucleoside N-ribohydrolase
MMPTFMKNILLDIETSDPDDVMMLLLAAAHPRVNLLAVTGGPEKCL